jgi:TM2 domain-containing membrane protein YozV
MPYGQPTKDKAIAYILEIVLLGLGWIYAGETGTGIAILASWLIVGLGLGITVDFVTGGLGCLCTGPLSIAA